MADLKGFNSKDSGQGSSIADDKIANNLTHSEASSDTLGLKNPALRSSGYPTGSGVHISGSNNWSSGPCYWFSFTRNCTKFK